MANEDKNYVRVITVKVGEEDYFGFEIDQEIFKKLGYADGELLELHQTNDSLILKKTGIIYSGSGSD